MNAQDLNSLSALQALSNELINPYSGVQKYVQDVLGDAEIIINTINTLISQPDYSTYVSAEESQYFTDLTTYITNFINNFPTLKE
jgi:hypothetical protein